MIAIHIYVGNISTEPGREGRVVVSGELKYLNPNVAFDDHVIETFPGKPKDIDLDQLESFIEEIRAALR